MVRALARAFRWRKLLETGMYGTIEELAAAEKMMWGSRHRGTLSGVMALADDVIDKTVLSHIPRAHPVACFALGGRLFWSVAGTGYSMCRGQ